MKLGLALGAAVLATTMVAYAHTAGGRHFVFHRSEPQNADANSDGWLTREEAAAHADRMFDDLDRDGNGRLEAVDHDALRHEVEAEVERSLERVRVDLEGLEEEIELRFAHLDEENCTRETETEGGERRVTVVCRIETGSDGDGQRRTERRVQVLRGGPGRRAIDVTPQIAPVPPIPPAPIVVVWGGDEESDLNGDGWLSREEFRAQQLRHFDARDANGDRRVRQRFAPGPPVPAEAPEPPAPR